MNESFSQISLIEDGIYFLKDHRPTAKLCASLTPCFSDSEPGSVGGVDVMHDQLDDNSQQEQYENEVIDLLHETSIGNTSAKSFERWCSNKKHYTDISLLEINIPFSPRLYQASTIFRLQTLTQINRRLNVISNVRPDKKRAG